MSPLEWIGVGLIVLTTATFYDWANSNYIAANSANQPAATAFWSAIVATFGLVGMVGILTASRWLAIPEIAGFALGSYIATERRRRKAAR